MILGLAIATALYCLLTLAAQIYINCTGANYEVQWGDSAGWYCIFAGAGTSIGYIVEVMQ